MYWYFAKISVYGNNDQTVFVLLGDAGRELSGKHASGLVDNYFQVACHYFIHPPQLIKSN